jgi:acyl CoA:acetate/3-ketoacid CoA transferase alpha subunit
MLKNKLKVIDVKKLFANVNEAIFDISDGATIMVGGFGLCGIPEHLIKALYDKKVKDLTIISNNCGTTEYGLSWLLRANQIKKVIASYVGENKIFEHQYLSGQIELQLIPQGTLAEKLRAAGAGIPAFYTKTGIGTVIEKGGLPIKYDNKSKPIKLSAPKETRIFNNQTYLLEESLYADFALVKASKSDHFGNLVFNKTTQNFNPMMCTAAKTSIVEVEELLANGNIEPENVHTPGIYVKRIVHGLKYQKIIEHKTNQVRTSHATF